MLLRAQQLEAGVGSTGREVRIFQQILPLDPTRELRSITLPAENRVEVWAITLKRPIQSAP